MTAPSARDCAFPGTWLCWPVVRGAWAVGCARVLGVPHLPHKLCVPQLPFLPHAAQAHVSDLLTAAVAHDQALCLQPSSDGLCAGSAPDSARAPGTAVPSQLALDGSGASATTAAWALAVLLIHRQPAAWHTIHRHVRLIRGSAFGHLGT